MTVVIINPMSGPGRGSAETRGRDRLARAQQVLRDAGTPYRIELTSGPGHGEALAREALAARASLVCAWGGDGTANEIASVLAFSSVPLGLVPNGSGNGLARELGVSLKPSAALRQALTGTDRLLDVGEIGGRLFFNVAGIGFDAHVARLFNQSGRRRGFLAYIKTSMVELFRYDAQRYLITLPPCAVSPGRLPLDALPSDTRPSGTRPSGEVLQRDALMVVIANTAQYGNGARIAPQAKPDDGRLDLVVVTAQSALASMWQSRRMFDGSLARASHVMMRAIDTAEIAVLAASTNGAGPAAGSAAGAGADARGATGAMIGFHVDGEPVEAAGPLRVRVHPRALRMRVPAAAR
jgi:diacylglycerol kinase family enzyme